MSTQKPAVHVVAGILFNEAGHFLLTSRPEGKVYAGYWEFAGGKVEAGETELEALRREFIEELNIHIDEATCWLTKSHEYEHASVYLRFYKVHQWHGEIQPQENQTYCWQDPAQLDKAPMLPANEAILKALRIPERLQGSLAHIYWQTPAGQVNIYPSGCATEQDGILLTPAELSLPEKQPHPWVWVQIETQADIRLAVEAHADALVCVINSEAKLKQVAEWLRQGIPLALIVQNPHGFDLKPLQPCYPSLLA